MKINVSKGKDNYSQRNNKLKPLESCNVTSMVMALSYLGYKFPAGKFDQPEDNLRAFIEARGGDPTVHADLSDGVNQWIGRPVTNFRTDREVPQLWAELAAGRPVVLSGTFPGFPKLARRPLGHIVCLVGAEWAGDDIHAEPERVIIDDPYGNTLNNWQGPGNDIALTFDQFTAWLKPTGSALVKWGHFFKAAR
jgi:hypothetical protein